MAATVAEDFRLGHTFEKKTCATTCETPLVSLKENCIAVELQRIAEYCLT